MGDTYFLLFHENNCPLALRNMVPEVLIIVINSIEHNVNVQSPIYPSASAHVIRFHCIYYLWFSCCYAAASVASASAFHHLRDNLENPYIGLLTYFM